MSELRPYPKPSYPQRIKTAAHYLLPQLAVTRAAGWLADRRWGVLTTLAVKTFAACYKIDLAEAEKSRRRRLRQLQRILHPHPQTRRAPHRAAPDYPLPARRRPRQRSRRHRKRPPHPRPKATAFTTLELLAGDETLAAQFSDGLFLTTYLSPRDYHRVHMPCAATLRRMVYVPGELYSVNPFLARHIPNLFARNERLICVFDTAFGSMVQILVGATVTASISTTWAGIINPPRPQTVLQWLYPAEGADAVKLEKGQEMGAFRLGSTVINLFPHNSIRLADTLRPGTQTRMGGLLGERIQAV